MDLFENWARDAMLMELQVNSLFYTWIEVGARRSQSKLDRVFINMEWHQKFNMAEVKGLSRVLSDHIPHLSIPKNAREELRLFRYERVWHTHVKFKEVVSGWWAEAPITSSACLSLS